MSARSEVVVAGAGTGKTHALVHAYLAALLGLDQGGEVRSPARVLAITFTDKAAAEMRARVQLALAAISRGEISASVEDLMERHQCQLPSRKEIDKVLRHSSSAPISTFHSLCHRLLRDFAMHVDLDPGFALMGERDLSELLREVAEACVLDRLASEDAHVAELTARFGLRRMGFGRGLVDELVEVTLKLAERGLAAADLNLVVTEAQADESVLRAREAIQGNLKVIHQEQRDANALIRRLAGPLLHNYVQLHEALDAGRDTEAEIDLAEAYDLFRARVREAFGQGDLLHAREAAAERLDELGGALCDRVTAPHARAVRELLVDIETRARLEKRARGALGFGDLLTETRDLLQEPTLRARVKGRYDRVLVDEYQDTSPVQEDLVALLCERLDRNDGLGRRERATEVLELEPGRLFLVGDPRQSIYGFRGADVRVFRRTFKAVVMPDPPREASGERRVLKDSYRSRASVVALVNHVARTTLKSIKYRAEEDLVPIRSAQSEIAGACWVPSKRMPGMDPLVLEGQVTANGIRRLLDEGLKVGDDERPLRPGDIAVLVRRIRAATPIARSLTHVGVPAQVLGGEGFFARPEVCDLLAALRLVVEPDDEVATLTVLRSPLVGAADSAIADALTRGGGRARGWPQVLAAAAEGALGEAGGRAHDLGALIEGLRAGLPRETTARMIDRLLDEGGYLEAIGVDADAALGFANVEKLRAMAEHPPGRALETITRFWSWLDDPPKESLADTIDPTTDAVRVLTMHRAKGLEFPVVVLSDLSARPPPNTAQIGFDPDLGLAVTCRGRPIELCAPHEKSARSTTAIDRLARALSKREREERARLLYVALTRARDFLYVVSLDKIDRARDEREASMRQILEEARRADRHKFDALLPKERIDPDLGPSRPPPETKLPEAIAPELEPLEEPIRVVPSALVRGVERASDVVIADKPESLERVRALRRGRLAHRLIALVGAAQDPTLLGDEAELAAWLDAAVRAEGRDPQEPSTVALVAQVTATLSGPVLGLVNAGFSLSFEEHAAAAVGRARLVGTVDLVARTAEATWVIDFKSSKGAVHHVATRAQLAAYASAIEARGENVAVAAWVIGDRQPPRPVSVPEADRALLENAVEAARP